MPSKQTTLLGVTLAQNLGTVAERYIADLHGICVIYAAEDGTIPVIVCAKDHANSDTLLELMEGCAVQIKLLTSKLKGRTGDAGTRQDREALGEQVEEVALADAGARQADDEVRGTDEAAPEGARKQD